MSNLTDRVSYLKGLAEGMQLDKDKNVNKLLLEMISVMDDMAHEMGDMQETYDELNEYVESIDDDLADLEDVLFGDEDDEGCGCHGHDDDDDDDDDEDDNDDDDDDDDEMIAYACPHCNHEIHFNAADVDFDEDYLCPSCGQSVFPQLDEGQIPSDMQDDE